MRDIGRICLIKNNLHPGKFPAWIELCRESLSTYIMDELSLQKANRFQGEQVVKQEGVGVFESTNNTSENDGNGLERGTPFQISTSVKPVLIMNLWASTRACEALSSV